MTPAPADAPNPASGDRPARATLQSVQVMRGLAALAVVLYHTHLFIARPEYGGIDVFGSVVTFGWSGVNFFFVLSGFIILLAHERDIGRPDRATNYLWRRFSRVYPIYWLFLTLYILAAATGLGEPDFSWAPQNLAASYLLVQLGEAPSLPLKVAWTLFYEIAFYAAFLLLILNRRIGGVLVSMWVLVIVFNGLILGRTTDGWYLHAWNLYFLVGAATWLAAKRLPTAWGLTILAAGLGLLVLAMASGFVDARIGDFQDRPVRLALLSLPFALILLGAALAERHHDWRPPAALMLLGEASYAIYLIHSAAISVLAPLMHKFVPGLPGALTFLAVATGAVVPGIIAHVIAERPILRWMRAIGPRGKRARAASEVTA